MYDLIIFDFDFTLVDSSDGIVASMRYAFQKMGLDVPAEAKIKDTIGMPLKESFVFLSGIADEKACNLFKYFFMQASKDVMCKNTRLFNDTIDTLKALKKIGKRIAIVSAKDKKTIQTIAGKHRFSKYIDIVIGEDEVINQKPHPDQVQIVLDVFQIPASSVLYIGDSLIDGLTAQNASVDFLAVTTGTTPVKEFTQIPHIGNVASLGEALRFID